MENLENAKQPILFFQNSLGDHILTLPAIRALFNIYGSKLSVISNKGKNKTWFYSEFELNHFVELELDFRLNPRRLPVDEKEIELFIGECDLLISLCPWHDENIEELIEIINPEKAIGLTQFFNNPKPINYNLHAVDFAFQIPQMIQPRHELQDLCYPPIFPDEYEKKAMEILSLLPKEYKKLVIHTETEPSREWCLDKFFNVLDAFLVNNEDYIVLLVDIEDRGLRRGSNIERIYPLNGFYFPTISKVIEKSDLFLGIDSSFLHMADIYHVAGVGLFGATLTKDWGFRYCKRNIEIEKQGMSKINIDETIIALQKLVEKR